MALPPLIRANVQAIEAEQRRLRARIYEAQVKMNSLERLKRKMTRKIQQVAKRLAQIAGQSVPIDMVREVEKEINEEGYMERIIENRFKYQAVNGRGSQRWTKLSPRTVAERIRDGFPGSRPILEQTGVLKSAAINAARGKFKLQGNIDLNVEDVPVEYAAALHYGAPSHRLPARPFFNNPSDVELGPALKAAQSKLRMKLRKRMRMEES